MMNKAIEIKNMLFADVDAMVANPQTFVKEPLRDFTRFRKLCAKDVLLFSIMMERDTMDRELLKYFDFKIDTPSMSAYFQQRRKLLPDTYHCLLDTFNAHFEPSIKTAMSCLLLMDLDLISFSIPRIRLPT